MENAVQVFQYNGNAITFGRGDSVMINATEMAKGFNKRPNDYLNLTSTNELITAITRKNGIAENQLVTTIRGGSNSGTWLHEDVALDFAQWLSIDFKLWCNDRIKELVRDGVSTISDDDEVIAHAMAVLQKRLDSAKQRNQQLEGENELLQKENKELTPKAAYTDEVLQSTSTFTFTQISKDLGFKSVYALLEKLEARCIVYRQSKQWLPTTKVSDKGFFSTRTAKYVKSDGSVGSSISTVITEKGREYLHGLFNPALCN